MSLISYFFKQDACQKCKKIAKCINFSGNCHDFVNFVLKYRMIVCEIQLLSCFYDDLMAVALDPVAPCSRSRMTAPSKSSSTLVCVAR